MSTAAHNDEYQLYDLKVEVFQSDNGKPMVCRHHAGDSFMLVDEDRLYFPPGVMFPIYPLAAILPLLPAKQRPLSPNDWMATDAVIACPDPNCGGRFRITRGELRTYRHSEQTVTPLVKP
ncbi:MAG: TIGR04076 family protein [Steroidobacteraceae bacterium]